MDNWVMNQNYKLRRKKLAVLFMGVLAKVNKKKNGNNVVWNFIAIENKIGLFGFWKS